MISQKRIEYSNMLHETSSSSDPAYLRQLGERVRSERRRQDMNRKALAGRSGVSERFLAQLEAGSGNISVLRLRHVAQALNASINSLLSDESSHTADDARKKNRIALIGLRGAGKTTLGKIAAGELGVGFVELTKRIENSSGLALPDIFNLYGTEGYRRLEQRELSAVIDEYDGCILAAAGGISENSETFEMLLAHFHTIWLTATPEEHMQRVISQGDFRPMHGHDEALSELKAILGARARDYARAGHIVDTAGRSLAEARFELVEAIRQV